MKIHEKYILRCIELGKNGLGTTAPNPMVGCVILCDNTIIGEGFTSPFGGHHAEVNAINSVKDKSLLKKATLYVSLEPCSHFGKTPPCTDLIIKSGIPRVVIGLKDPHSKVAGKGIHALRKAGIEVIFPVLEEACEDHHKRFLTFHLKKRPYIILKWAESADGYIAPTSELREKKPQPFWISNRYSKQLVHQWRAEEQAILVGTNTVLEDNPKLNARTWVGKSPLRVVLDRELKIPSDYNVFDDSADTLVYTNSDSDGPKQKGAEIQTIDFSRKVVETICQDLHSRQVQSIIVEGGAQTLISFIKAKAWDEARIFVGNSEFGDGIKAPVITAREIEKKRIATDTLRILKND
ncbi:bifunctional diaminohydroxyphosphoribosylaminopyrimidine deaminase/5-amino-6-(5-phosphoribosylamino)uracil reductase RibD [Muriicola soli]|uniref:Riboflavin biosynthesis protein RibD n=1 Tax=Muriicola soli TaxID=2507538 RepID=A0A411E9J3_9FLAO|nr:bifunctional diaminohydroxyphosphoribosylaminopyrimidine deaminase/5-amino-6-(5-phosphoribosylamino)uracil reductase RibD [Muriicola soli]QBA64381.1 bifunctional diaminohydroxyphosphoribosylaminopyrimidine deaminase/5-amino-6-(5-phosphoribosylamino)uracil reductase RibD [Muriicola soli]